MKQIHKQTIVARAVIINRGRIFCTFANRGGFYFLPGGHVEINEKVETSLRRELLEELGVRVKTLKFIGAHDNHFSDSPRERHHEIGLVFSVTTAKLPTNTLEGHISGVWVPLTELTKIKLMPRDIGRAIVNWTKTKKPFWLVRDDQ